MMQKKAALFVCLVGILVRLGFSQDARSPLVQDSQGLRNSLRLTSSGSTIVLANNSSELVRIPRPKGTSLSNPKRNCPHNLRGLREWHNSRTWPGGMYPRSGENATIPARSRVVITRTISVQLGYVTIPSTSELIIGSNPNGINITAKGFTVFGKLTAGSHECRIESPITITLIGRRPRNASTSPPPSNYKGIVVSGGKLVLHGQRYFNTWTRLAKSVSVGDTILTLQETVNWVAGQKLVLVSSAMKDSRDNNQNEVMTIQSVTNSPSGGVGAIVRVKEKAKFDHTANQYYQVEVGLLSRTIKIQGSPTDSEPSDPDPLDGSCMFSPLSEEDWTIYYGTTQPCMEKHLTGFGGHIRIENNGVGQIQGVELYRMGQTNVKGRYPMHFHLLGSCPTCYFRASSIHRSFYRCIAIHGTHESITTENVAFDILGYCYYLEDGVEENNTFSFNLASHVHTIGPDIPWGWGQTTNTYKEGPDLTLPADVTASGFYITNVHNTIIGNAASGGWAGFAFPILPKSIGLHKGNGYRPNLAVGLTIDGNTAHSSGWWWWHAGALYFGGELYYDESDNLLTYNPGRPEYFGRNPCSVDPCLEPYNYCDGCPEIAQQFLKVTNTKTFLTAGVGLNSWTGPMEIIGYESHDSRLAIEALNPGFWMDNALVVCRTGSPLIMPASNAYKLEGNGFVWYDTYQEHIITRTTFRNCGYRSKAYDQYDDSPDRGCESSSTTGCRWDSSVFGFLTHSDEFTPQVMQGTKEIYFENCGRRFRFSSDEKDSVSARGQNWLDADGSASGLWEPTIIGSGLESVKDWWGADRDSVYEPQAPLFFTPVNGGPQRRVGSFRMEWDDELHGKVGKVICVNGDDLPCPWEGFVRHAGKMFSPFANSGSVNKGMPLTARGDITGPTGGFGWIVSLNNTAPRSINFSGLEIDPTSVMLLSIPYPVGTSFEITAHSVDWCWDDWPYLCSESFYSVSSLSAVRSSAGNTFFVDNNGVLTFRLAQPSSDFTSNPNFLIPDYWTPPRRPDVDFWALPRFERSGVLLPVIQWGQQYHIQATCPGDDSDSPQTGYCPEAVQDTYDPDVCPRGYTQLAYDKCCNVRRLSQCVFSDGTRNY